MPIVAQVINIRTDIDNRAHNSALLSNVMLDVFGEKTVNTWLEQNTRFMLQVKTDNLGKVMDMKLCKAHKGLKMHNKDIKKVFQYVQTHDIRFPYAVMDETGIGIRKSTQLCREQYKSDGYFSMVIAFPGENYNYMLLRNDKPDVNRVEVLKQIIRRYTTPTIKEEIVNTPIKVVNTPDTIPFDTIPYLHYDKYFFQAYDELTAMMDGRRKYDLKRAVFLSEWAYLSGKLDYKKYTSHINGSVNRLKKFIELKQIQNYRTAPNAALFDFFTNPSWMNDNKAFSYDVEDVTGDKDYTKLFVTKVMQTHMGQCSSLPLYYKILCNELGGEASLARAPGHVYIKHLDEDGQWVNVELTTASLATDYGYIRTMKVSTESIRNGMFMTAMTDQEDIAFAIERLAMAYVKKYKKYDYFTLLCANNIRKWLPNNFSGLVLYINTYREWGWGYTKNIGKVPSSYIYNNYAQFKSADNTLKKMGFTMLDEDEYVHNVNTYFKELGMEPTEKWIQFRDRKR